MAVLEMFYRIFSASKMLLNRIWTLVTMLDGWGIAVIMVSIHSCKPTPRFWDRSIPGTGINSSNFFIGITAPKFVSDLLTILLPVRGVLALQMARDKKFAMSYVFLLGGGSVVLASVRRLILFAIYRPGPEPRATISVKRSLSYPPPTYGSRSARMKGPNSQRKLSALNEFNTLVTVGKISDRGGGRMKRSEENDDFDGSSERFKDSDSLQGLSDGLYVKSNGAVKNENRVNSENGIHVQRDVCVERSDKVIFKDIKDWVVGDIQ
ncbi:hypothetical protein CORC01_04880 [Colletotrichum orchidophilum]|uniref:Rhodopsin domain-containing protein n=1 Tax=Colletotrichum orchidophilum TaxID=1209926 RepID=A0A1G4BE93_9PEZI|nr:uncharacterized protein CORC01_04880 [Colletotrichum orchidophilum]OHE99744.1 hypothetical protein CORC01_04880 [Colletotrichum orchidophilum]